MDKSTDTEIEPCFINRRETI